MDCSMPGFPVLHYLLDFAQTHVHWVGWWHPTLSSSVVHFSSCLQSFPASGSSPVSRLFTSGGQSIEASASASVLLMNIQGWFPLGFTGLISLQSKGLSRVFSSTKFLRWLVSNSNYLCQLDKPPDSGAFFPCLLISHLFFLDQQPPVFLTLVIGFLEDNFSTDWGGRRWFQDDSSTLHLLCTFIFFLHQLHLRSLALDPSLKTPVLSYSWFLRTWGSFLYHSVRLLLSLRY